MREVLAESKLMREKSLQHERVQGHLKSQFFHPGSAIRPDETLRNWQKFAGRTMTGAFFHVGDAAHLPPLLYHAYAL